MENFTDYNNYNSFSYYPSSNLLALMLLCDTRYMNQDCYNLRDQIELNMRSSTMSISDGMINVNEQLKRDMQNTCCLQLTQATTEEIEQLKQSCRNICSVQYPDPIVTYIDELYANGVVYASVSHSQEADPITDCYKSVEEINTDLFKNEGLESKSNMLPLKILAVIFSLLINITLDNNEIITIIIRILFGIMSLSLALLIINGENKT